MHTYYDIPWYMRHLYACDISIAWADGARWNLRTRTEKKGIPCIVLYIRGILIRPGGRLLSTGTIYCLHTTQHFCHECTCLRLAAVFEVLAVVLSGAVLSRSTKSPGGGDGTGDHAAWCQQ